MNKRTSFTESDLNPAQLQAQLMALARAPWSSLAIIPTEITTSSTPVAEMLVELARLTAERPTRMFCAEHLSAGVVPTLLAEMMAHVHNGGRAVLALDAVICKPSGIALAMAADASLLCVHLGVSTTVDAKSTIGLIGRERFIGAVTLKSIPFPA